MDRPQARDRMTLGSRSKTASRRQTYLWMPVRGHRPPPLRSMNAHDCANFKRFVAQQVAGSTNRVATAVQEMKCTEKSQPGNATADRASTNDHRESQQSPSDSTAVTTPKGASVAKTSGENNCNTMNVNDVMDQASNYHNARNDKLALATISKALACKTAPSMYQAATAYACAAHDLANAKLYFGKVPPVYQADLDQQCKQQGLDVRSP